MARLRFSNQVPPGGFYYRQKESHLIIHGESIGDLVERVKLHREHKGFTPSDAASIRLDCERQICMRMSREFCIAEPNDEWTPIPDDGSLLDLDKIAAFSGSAWEFLKGRGKLCDREEAERRREICASCPANVQPTGCMACGLNKIINSVVPPERSYPDLRACAFCSCELRSKVNMPEAVIVASDKGRNIQYPAHCWQRSILEAKK